jgi:hypothetical protein
MLATSMGQYDEAEAHFAAVLAFHERIGLPFHIARAKLEWGRMFIARGEPEVARPLLETARDLAHRHGCAQVERRAERLLTASG